MYVNAQNVDEIYKMEELYVEPLKPVSYSVHSESALDGTLITMKH